eukprot:NODE_392_length_9456_cov_0.345517.p3 type:complete len:292 gc:universal NODE_392_length_9456_cov_0.345517:3820-4695(+)
MLKIRETVIMDALTVESSIDVHQLELLKSKHISLSNEDLEELNEEELMELVYLGMLGKGCYANNELKNAKEYYLHFLEYFNSESWKMDKKWMNWENQNKREIKIATGLRRLEVIKKYKNVTLADLVEWIKAEKDDIKSVLMEILELLVIHSVQDLYMIDLELQMQEIATKVPNNTPVDSTITKMATTGPLLSQQGKLLRPFTLLSEKQRNIFKPSHNLPTMTIDEYIEEEIQRGGIVLDRKDTAIDLKDMGYALDEDQDWNAIEDQRQKDIQWDTFKDENPRGHGNRIGKG